MSASARGRIEAVSEQALAGRERIDAQGLVVAPGFIDLHSHINDAAMYLLAAQEGVTTALELEIGVPDVAAFYESRRGKARINFGTSASHPWARAAAFGDARRRRRARAAERTRDGDCRRRRRAPGDAAADRARTRRRRAGRRHGTGLHARCDQVRSHRGLSYCRRASCPGLRPRSQLRPGRARIEHRVRRGSDRRRRDHRRGASHRARQQQLHGRRAGMPADDRRRPPARSRRHGRGLSLRRGHDRSEVGGLQPGMAAAHRHHRTRGRDSRDGRAADG